MRRCVDCGRRWRGPHPGCASRGPGDGTGERREDLPRSMRVTGYRVDRMLGYGGFATVWAGVRERDGAAVAIKVASDRTPEHAARLDAERDALHAIGPPAVPAVHDTGTLEDGTAFLVMDLIAQPTLADRLGELADGM